jgi:hypothetical protein
MRLAVGGRLAPSTWRSVRTEASAGVSAGFARLLVRAAVSRLGIGVVLVMARFA